MTEIESILMRFLKQFDITEIDQQLIYSLSLQCRIQNYPKKIILSKEGSHNKYVFIIKKGFVRRYAISDGKDITLEFAQENEMITSRYALVTGNPTIDYIETIEDSVVLKFNFESIKELHSIYQIAPKIGNVLRDRYFLKLENRILTLQKSSGEARYNDLLQNHEHILKRASLGQIASYLGMTQENLSRIRAKKS
ncbi:MAG: Crp/Fnr family transcriptional regulator [Thermonemataceae bacterium]